MKEHHDTTTKVVPIPTLLDLRNVLLLLSTRSKKEREFSWAKDNRFNNVLQLFKR